MYNNKNETHWSEHVAMIACIALSLFFFVLVCKVTLKIIEHQSHYGYVWDDQDQRYYWVDLRT